MSQNTNTISTAIETPILKSNNLNLGYRNGKKQHLVAEHLNFELQTGKLTCLLGPNGVGKSTLIKTIMGQVPPLGGDIFLEGKPIQTFHQKNLAKKIAVVLTEKITTGNLTVSQLVALGRIPHTGWLGNLSDADKAKVQNAILATHISYLKDQRLSELSDGQLQKVMIARALAQDGEILILDEPTAHLDLINRFEIMHLLRDIALKEQKAVLVVTHDLDIAIETADVFWLMQCGKPLVCGSPEDLILDNQINLLLPTEKLSFNKLNGKIQESKGFIYPKIEGPEDMTNWLKLALRKNNITPLPEYISISVDQNTRKFILNDGKREFGFSHVEKLVAQLQTIQDQEQQRG
jgi:iron complex transport system ATP-binding protein